MIFIYIVVIAFLLGIVFVQWLIPLVDSIVNLILTQLEVWKGAMAVKLTKYQKQTSDIKREFEEHKKSGIGFIMTEEGDDDEQIL